MDKMKAVGYTILAAMVAAIVVLSVVCSIQGGKIKSYKLQIVESETIIDSLTNKCARLAGMEAISCSVTFNMKNNAVLGVNNVHAEQIAEQVAVYTRGEILKIQDSLNNGQSF